MSNIHFFLQGKGGVGKTLTSSFTAQYLKENYPDIKISMGGGFPNTELRSLKDVRVFEFFDFFGFLRVLGDLLQIMGENL